MKRSAARSPHQPIAYFQPGETVFVVKHNQPGAIDRFDKNQIDSLIKWSNDSRGEFTNLHVAFRRSISFQVPSSPKYPEQQRVEYPPHYRVPPVELPSPFTLVFADVTAGDVPAGASDLSGLVVRLDGIRDKTPLSSENSLELVSPNWLSSASSELGGGGGPGARPVPFRGASDTTQYEIHLPQEAEGLCPKNQDERGKGVKVAILDTAPCLHDLSAAYERYQKVGSPPNNPPRHRLIESLLKPGGPLHVHPASYDDLQRMRSVHLEDHNYSMTDHGLFVAGIIHTIAPAAELHLIEVLNPDGVGDIDSISQGFMGVLNEEYFKWKDGPMVVNCSLMLNIPRRGHPTVDLDPRLAALVSSDTQRMGWPIKWICDLIYALESRVIAAAGNDHEQKNQPQPPARYPAAFDSVLGIGALPDYSKPQHGTLRDTSYSNVADEPGSDGVTIFGGDARPDGMTDPKYGMLGLYLGEFPSKPVKPLRGPEKPDPENENDWALWAGTSFATPIMTGTLAAVLSATPRPRTTQDALGELYRAHGILDNQTDKHEDGMFVTQG